MFLSKYIHVQSILMPQITYYAFQKLNIIRNLSYKSQNNDNIILDNIINTISLDKDCYLKHIMFGDKILIFQIPIPKCDPAPDDSDMSNKDIDPDTWMDIPPY